MDASNGYESVAPQFIAGRGGPQSSGIGAASVRSWARALPRGANVLDLGCGTGLPLTIILVQEGLNAFGIDASPSLVDEFCHNLPGIPVLCEAVQTSTFFKRTFDGVLAWGLLFLLSPEDQRHLLQRIATVLDPGGRLLFTAPAGPLAWNDVMTGLPSQSLGAGEYHRRLAQAGVLITHEYEDEGQNHYYEAVRTG